MCDVCVCVLQAALFSLENVKQDVHGGGGGGNIAASVSPRGRVMHTDPMIHKRPSSRDRHVRHVTVYHTLHTHTHTHVAHESRHTAASPLPLSMMFGRWLGGWCELCGRLA